MFGTPLEPPLGAGPLVLCIALALGCAITDLWRGRVYNTATYAGLALGFVTQTWFGAGPSFALGGLLTGAAPMLLLFAFGGVGGGDVKLFAALGMLLGARRTLVLIPLAFAFALVVALAQLAWQGRLFRTVWNSVRAPLSRSQQRLAVPFALPILLGTLAVLFDFDLLAIGGW